MKTRVKVEYVIDYELSTSDATIEALNFVPKDARSLKSEAWLLKESQPKPVDTVTIPPKIEIVPAPPVEMGVSFSEPAVIPEGMCPEGCGHPVEDHDEGSGCLGRMVDGKPAPRDPRSTSGVYCNCMYKPASTPVIEAAPEPPVPLDDAALVRPIGDTEPAF